MPALLLPPSGGGTITQFTPAPDPTPPTAPLRICGTRGAAPRIVFTSDAGSTRVLSRIKSKWGGQTGTEMWIAYGHSLGGGGSDHNLACAAEINGYVIRAPYRGSSRTNAPAASGIYRNTDSLIWFGPIYPAQCGLVTFPAGMTFWVRTEAELSVGDQWQGGDVYNVTGEGTWLLPVAFLSRLLEIGPPDFTATTPDTTQGVAPLAIIGRTTSPELAAIHVGDSNAVANGSTPATRDFGDGFSGGSYFKRAMSSVNGRTIPWSVQATNGITALMMQGLISTLSPLWPFATHILVHLGTNDLVLQSSGSAGGQSAAATKVSLVAIFNAIKAAGTIKTMWSKVPPATTSTDAFATLANQTPFTNFGSGGTLRAPLIASLTAGFDNLDYIFALDGWQAVAFGNDLWVAGTGTDDSTHGKAGAGNAHANAGAALATYMATQ